jgi:NitT/TauT family transport system substrate-binding protein
MHARQAEGWTRRRFLGGVTVAGTAGLLSLCPRLLAAEPPPETTKLRLAQSPSLCISPLYVAADLLPAEGFTEVQYVKLTGALIPPAVAAGEVDLAMTFVGPLLLRLDAEDPLVILAGGHVGCFELIGTDRVRAIRDLKGRTVTVPQLGSPQHVFLASMAAYVGLDPNNDIHWVTHPAAESIQLLAEGKVDALLGFPPIPQELRAKQVGHVVVNSAVDRPWSQYFCCLMYANQAFVRTHPVATKRAVRAILKAVDVCARDPGRAAQFLVDQGYTTSDVYTRQTLREVPYDRWREYEPEDTVRFYALRLQEAGMIKATPQKLIAQGTDWRFLNELKKELKG